MNDADRRTAAMSLASRALSEVTSVWVAEILNLAGQHADVDVQSITTMVNESAVVLPVYPEQRHDADPDAD